MNDHLFDVFYEIKSSLKIRRSNWTKYILEHERCLPKSIIKVKFWIIQEIPHKNTKLPEQHHGKKTVNVKVYQNTKIDTQIHITDKKRGRMEVPPWNGQRHITLEGGWGCGKPNLTLSPSPSYKTYSVNKSITSPTYLQQPRRQTHM